MKKIFFITFYFSVIFSQNISQNGLELTKIDNFSISVEKLNDISKEIGLTRKKIIETVELKLTENKTPPNNNFKKNSFLINIECLPINYSDGRSTGMYVYNIQTNFIRPVTFNKSENLFSLSKASVWNNYSSGFTNNSFTIINDVLEMVDKFSSDFDLIIGKNLRYIWQDNLREPKNSISRLSKTSFTYEKVVLSGKDYYHNTLNQVSIPGGGEWMVKRNVYEKVIEKFGYFSPNAPTVEFFCHRASAYFSKKVILIDYPVFINGRKAKSIGNFLNKNNSVEFDWGFENPNGKWEYCPIKTYNYITISHEGALSVKELTSVGNVSKYLWGKEYMRMLLNEQYGVDNTNKTPIIRNLYLSVIKNYPIGSCIGFFKYTMLKALKKFNKILFHRPNKNNKNQFSIILKENYLNCEVIGVKNISDLSEWFLTVSKRFN